MSQRSEVLVAHQPAYLPWPGYFSRLLDVDRLVLLDHVAYSVRGWQNRNFVADPRGQHLRLTVPVERAFARPLSEVRIAGDGWRARHWRTLTQSYARAAHWPELQPRLHSVYQHHWDLLADLNEALLRVMLDAFGLKVRLERSSAIAPQGAKSAMLADLCRRTGTSVLRLGTGAESYVDTALLAEHGLTAEVATYSTPPYGQGRRAFTAGLSALDLLAHHGADARRVLETGAHLRPMAPLCEDVTA